MTPLYNSNEYYKKMLELQERLRKSEEERIRLEERFTLLEHESRSRHETCINRLRMRYIEFLEDQQARDERNYQLLGALDRVDNSLALMSAKTDRLGALKKQYEASMLSANENRRPNSSLTGDSGVASQNEERQRRFDGSLRHRVARIDRHHEKGHQGRGSHRTSESPSQVRSGSSSPYGNAWSGVRCESSHQPSLAFSRFTKGGTTYLSSRNGEFSTRLINDVPANSGSSIGTNNSPIGRQATNESFNYKSVIPPRVQSPYDNRIVDDQFSAYPNVAIQRNRQVSLPGSKYGESVSKYSDGVSGIENPQERVNAVLSRSKPSRRDSVFTPSLNENNENRHGTSKSPKLSAVLREELGDGEEEEKNDYIGGVVENQLERYISKIRSLHRDAEPRSVEEIDHEENNTSGDLLNVTLSDDALDLPVEEKQPRDDSFSRGLGNVLALAEDLADRTAASATNVANNICQNGGQLVSPNEELEESKSPITARRDESNIGPIGGSVTAHRSASIDELHDQENLSTYETSESLANNGISLDVAKSSAESNSGPNRNIQHIAKLARSPGGKNENGKSASIRDPPKLARDESRISAGKRDEPLKASSGFGRLDESLGGLVIGQQRENDEHLDDGLEDLEPWNLIALEKRVQELTLNDESQSDFDPSDISRVGDHSSSRPDQFENETEVGGESNEARVSELQVEEYVNENEKTVSIDSPLHNATRVIDEKKITDEPREKESPSEERTKRIFSASAESTSENNQVGSHAENIVARNDTNENDPGIAYDQEQYASRENETYDHQAFEGPNTQYEYSAEAPYDPNGNYNLNENSQYDGYQGEGYEYAESHYDQAPQQGYTQEPVDQQEYAQAPQDYPQDSSQLEYLEDSGQPNEVDPIDERYITHDSNPTDQRFEAVPNNGQYDNISPDQQYEADTVNEQYTTDTHHRYDTDPIEERYNADPADHLYETDTPDQQYCPDPSGSNNELYPTNPADQQYHSTPDQEYSTDANQPYVGDDQSYSADPNQQYTADGSKRYQDTSEKNPGDFNEEANIDKLYDTDGQYIENSDRRYSNDRDQEYSEVVQPNQQYSTEADYVQAKIQEYLYPPTVEYPNSEHQSSKESHDVRESEENTQKSVDPVTTAKEKVSPKEDSKARKTKDVIKSILDSDTESTIERNVSNTESDFDFN